MKWTIFNKLLAAFGIITVLMLTMAVENWNAMTNSTREAEYARDRAYEGAELAQNIKIDVISVWQWLTDVSATQAAEGFDDGFANAEVHADLFREHVAELKALQPDDAESLNALSETFEEFYAKGQWMAQQYIEGGSALGNQAMLDFDAYATEMNEKLDAIIVAMSEEAHTSLDVSIEHSTRSRRIGLILAVVAVLSAIGIAYFLASSMSRDLKQMVQAANAIALGNIDQQISIKRQDEIGDLAHAFQGMIAYQQEKATTASALAQGDLSVSAQVKGSDDVLGNAFQQMIDYQQQMAGAARQLAQGDLAVKVKPQSEKDVLGTAFQQMLAYQQQMAGVLEQVGRGNLAVEVKPYSDHDVLGTTVQTMLARLGKALIGVQANAHKLLSSSRQLSQVSEQAGDATQQIAETIDVMAGTTQQVAQTIGQVALGAAQQAAVMERSRMIVDEQDQVVSRITQGSIQQANSIDAADKIFRGRLSAAIELVESATSASDQAVFTAVDAAQSGSTAVSKTISGINSVAKTAEEVTHRISEMGKRSNQIGAIVQVINEIAERTNLLSLNAAIEAARAGEHGKGFAVVADEVRKLADRSAQSAEEITQLVRTVQEAANQAVAAMSENARQVQDNLDTAADAEEALTGIQRAMSQVGGQMKQLQGAVAELSGSSHQVQDAMQQVAGVIEENMEATTALSAGQEPLQHAIGEIASVAEENSAAAEEVAASAEENSASVEEISAMTKAVNTQISELSNAVVALSAMATDLQAVTNTFRLRAGDNLVDKLESFKQAHLQWAGRLQDMQKGKVVLHSEDLGDHTSCLLGEWYYGIGSEELGHLPEFNEIERPHAAMHQLVHEVVAAYNRNDMQSVEVGIHDVEQMSHRIDYLLEQLERRTEQGSSPLVSSSNGGASVGMRRHMVVA